MISAPDKELQSIQTTINSRILSSVTMIHPAAVGFRSGGQMGNERVTVQNLQVIKVMPEHNLLLVKGSVPGAKGSILLIEK